MRFREITEAPIEDFTTVGDWSKNSSYKDTDRKLLTNPKAVQKIITKWDKTPVDFNFYFINSPEANRHTEVGKVDEAWLFDNMPKAMREIELKPHAVNVLFTNNKGSEKVPMTAWVIAHRLSHVFARFQGWRGQRQVHGFKEARDILLQTISTILQDGYGQRDVPSHDRSEMRGNSEAIVATQTLIKNFYQVIGTMKSAREKNLRNAFEFSHELFAQYIITGTVKFNPIPMLIPGRARAYFRGPEGDLDYYNGLLDDCAEQLTYAFENMLHECVGSTFVM